MENIIQSSDGSSPRQAFRWAVLGSGAVMLFGFVLGFHFELDPRGSDWMGTVIWTVATFPFCWAIVVAILALVFRRKYTFAIIVFLLIAVVEILVWTGLLGGLFGSFKGAFVFFSILFSASTFPGLVFGLAIGLALIFRNGWKAALTFLVIGLMWAGYEFSLPRGDTRMQAVNAGSVEACKKSQAMIRDDCYMQVAVSTKDVTICDKKFSKNSGTWVDCYRKVGKVTNRIDLCNVGADGDAKTTCLKEVAINHKDLNACDALPKTSGVAGTNTYHQDCFRRVLDQLAVPTTASTTTEVAQWCRAAKAYPIFVTNGSAAFRTAFTQYCQ